MVKICHESIVDPLSCIFERCIETGMYPTQWKKANVIPVHKKVVNKIKIIIELDKHAIHEIDKHAIHEIDKHAILLVRKCRNGNVYTNFQDYPMINEHNVRTRNRNILLQIPNIKLDFAKNGYFFMGARIYSSLPKDIRESANDLENEINSYFSSKS